MKIPRLQDAPHPTEYDPNNMFDAIRREFKLTTTAELIRFLQIDYSQLYLVEKRRAALSAYHILHIHEATGWGVAYIRSLAGDQAEHYFKPARNFKWPKDPLWVASTKKPSV